MKELCLRAFEKLSVIIPPLIPIFLEDLEKGISILPSILALIKGNVINLFTILLH